MDRHIGILIRKELERQERTPTWLAKKIYCDRTNVHKIFKKKSIDIALLFNISKAMNHNFFKDIAQYYEEDKDNDPEE